jgi:hypothetical protein
VTIAPEVLDNVRAEAIDLRNNKHRIDDALRQSIGLMEFVEETFNQIFRTELRVGVSGFTQEDKEEILLLSGEPIEELAAEDLLRLYVDVCNMWPDVLNQAYGGTTADFLEFRAELVPSILAAVRDWAEARDDEALEGEVKEIWKEYKDAVAVAREAIGT